MNLWSIRENLVIYHQSLSSLTSLLIAWVAALTVHGFPAAVTHAVVWFRVVIQGVVRPQSYRCTNQTVVVQVTFTWKKAGIDYLKRWHIIIDSEKQHNKPIWWIKKHLFWYYFRSFSYICNMILWKILTYSHETKLLFNFLKHLLFSQWILGWC